MRVNVYHEELTGDVECIKKAAKTGAEYYGLHIYLLSAKELHNRPGDDDRTAVILWKENKQGLLELLSKAIETVKNSK